MHVASRQPIWSSQMGRPRCLYGRDGLRDGRPVGGERVSEPGDERLFAQLYAPLHRFAAVVKPPEVDADDLVQEALLRTLALRPLCEYEDPASYLRRTIVNLASNER